MMVDAYGLASSCASPEARAAFETAQRAFAGHRPQTAFAIGASLSADPHHIPALALKGFGQVLLARAELGAEAHDTFTAATAAVNESADTTTDERALVSALRHATEGNLRRSADVLDTSFADRPATLLPFKLAHQLRFMAGDRAGMLKASRRMLRAWEETAPGAGFMLGCHAFALEEHGRFEEAERAGRLAVELDADDAWGLHAVSHVFEMRGETARGIAWLEQSRLTWSGCNNFAFHVAWHLALYHLERGDHARVLSLYDEDVRPTQTDDFRDVSNAVSLLWRLEAHGVDVGDRWAHLSEVLLNRQSDATLAFASLHTLAGLLAIGDDTAADHVVAAIRRRAAGSDEQAAVARDIALPIAALMAGARILGARATVLSIADRLVELGGSNAQRDFFLLWVARHCAASGDRDGADRLLRVRRTFRRDDRLAVAVADALPPASSLQTIN
jgi:hypothetical protein